MDKKTRAKIKRYIGLASFALIALLLALLPVLTGGGEDDTLKPSILTVQAENGSISRILSGGGSLSVPDAETVSVPGGVTVRELLVAGGDCVEEGDRIALVDRVSVMTAVTEVQDALDTLTKKLSKAGNGLKFGAITVDAEGNVYSGRKKLEGDDLADFAEYYSLSQQHRDYEQTLLELFRIYQSGAITAPKAGMVDGLNKAIVQPLSDTGGAKISLLATNTPAGNGEEDDGITYLGFAGVISAVDTEGSTLDMLMNPIPTPLTNLADTSAVNTAVTAMTQPGIHDIATVFFWDGSAWQTVEELKSGDILLFVYNEGLEWILKLSSSDAETPDTPDTPDKPGTGEGGTNIPGIGDGNITIPGIGNGGITIPGGMDIGSLIGGHGSFGGFGGYGGQSQEPELYAISSTPLCTVIPLETMVLTISVDEQDIGSILPGMEAEVTLDAIPNRRFTAQVTSVSKFGTNNGGSSKYAVALELPWDPEMLPGMNAAASLTLETLEDVLLLPAAALVDTGNGTVVYTAYDEKTETLLNPVSVVTGLCDGENVQILSGLEPGTAVFYSYYDKVVISTTAENRNPFG